MNWLNPNNLSKSVEGIAKRIPRSRVDEEHRDTVRAICYWAGAAATFILAAASFWNLSWWLALILAFLALLGVLSPWFDGQSTKEQAARIRELSADLNASEALVATRALEIDDLKTINQTLVGEITEAIRRELENLLNVVAPDEKDHHALRVSLFVTSPGETHFTLISRAAGDPENLGIPGSRYDKIGAISFAWRNGTYISSPLPDSREDPAAWVTAARKTFRIGKARAEQSSMKPMRYGAWKLVRENTIPCAVLSAECMHEGDDVMATIEKWARQSQFQSSMTLLAKQVKDHWDRESNGIQGGE